MKYAYFVFASLVALWATVQTAVLIAHNLEHLYFISAIVLLAMMILFLLFLAADKINLTAEKVIFAVHLKKKERDRLRRVRKWLRARRDKERARKNQEKQKEKDLKIAAKKLKREPTPP